MTIDFVTLLQMLTTDEGVTIFTVLIAGLADFFSRCVQPIVPLYVGYLSGNADLETLSESQDEEAALALKRAKRTTLINTIAFVLGISFVYLALALAASSFGHFLQNSALTIRRIGGAIVLVLGIFQLLSQLTKLSAGRERRLSLNLDKYRMNPLVAFFLGFTFSFAWTPCIGPILLSVITLVANAGTLAKGLGLMLVYTLAFTVPFLLVGIFTTQVLNFFRKNRKIMKYTVIVGAILMIIMGITMLFDPFRML